MACILHIETSTDVCSVAASDFGQCIYHEEYRSGSTHNECLGSMVSRTLSFIDNHAIPLDAVAVSGGPGSYTGLRVGVSMAKGICYGRGIPLISVPTLKLLCVPVLLGYKGESDVSMDSALLCPMLDARRAEVYAAVYNRSLQELRPVQADVVEETTYNDWLDRETVLFFGNGSAKCRNIITHANARFIEGVEPLAKNMMPLAEQKYFRGETEDVAYFVPFYLKDFVAKEAKKLL